MQGSLFPAKNDDEKKSAESQIVEKQKLADYDIREYPVEVIIQKFTDKLEDDRAELFIPDYQRELVWSDYQQVRFIESILLDLPIPYLFVADVAEGENEGRIEIIDGSQRIRTLARFLANELTLRDLDILKLLDGFSFKDLPLPRQLRFKRKTLRMIELVSETDEEARRMLFDRLNSGGTPLGSMEQRMGSRDGLFLEFIKKMAKVQAFHDLCPIGPTRESRREYEELALRFFAYLDRYKDFTKRVDEFLDDYLDEKNSNGFNAAEMEAEFFRVLRFVSEKIPGGFRKNPTNNSVPRIRFEAMSVGTALALRENENLNPSSFQWLDSKEFVKLTRSDASNSRPRVIDRIHFVRDNLLNRPVEYYADQR